MATPEKVSDEMRRLLAMNREGKLTSDQWLAAVFEPLTPLLIFLTPFIVLLAAQAGRVGVLLGLGLGLGGTLWLGLSRMWRYARAPIQYGVMTASGDFQPIRLFGPPKFDAADATAFAFKRRYTPKFTLSKGARYGVYWMHDGNAPVLLSLSPIEHPNAGSWKPSPAFELRRAKRSRRVSSGA
jgi:hypothetical protein